MTPNYEYIATLREKRRTQQKVVSSSKNVLILGAGYVSEPVVEYLQRDQNISVTLGLTFLIYPLFFSFTIIFFHFFVKILVSALKNEADKIANKYQNVTPVLLDVTRSNEELEKLIKNHQIVIRYILHVSSFTTFPLFLFVYLPVCCHIHIIQLLLAYVLSTKLTW